LAKRRRCGWDFAPFVAAEKRVVGARAHDDGEPSADPRPPSKPPRVIESPSPGVISLDSEKR
jgi:hypothetical protein